MSEQKSMRRWVLKGGAKDLDGLVLEETAVPKPGPGQVRLRVQAASLNYRDQIILTGQYGVTVTEDMVPVSDGAGVVDAVGEGVEAWRVGDRAISVYYKGWVDGPPIPGMGFGLGSPGQQGGVLAEYAVLDADRVARAPESLDALGASTLTCAGLTAWTALNGDRPYTNRRIGAGDRVLVLGTGGVSLFALLLARAAGAEVVATTGKDDKFDRLRALGASDVLNYRTTSNWGEAVFERTGGVDHVVNAAGGESMDGSIAALAYGGEVALMGLFGQADAPPNLLLLMIKAASIRGTSVGGSAALADLVAAVDAHGIKPPIDRVFGFEEAKEAYLYQASGEAFGKVVVQVGEE